MSSMTNSGKGSGESHVALCRRFMAEPLLSQASWKRASRRDIAFAYSPTAVSTRFRSIAEQFDLLRVVDNDATRHSSICEDTATS